HARPAGWTGSHLGLLGKMSRSSVASFIQSAISHLRNELCWIHETKRDYKDHQHAYGVYNCHGGHKLSRLPTACCGHRSVNCNHESIATWSRHEEGQFEHSDGANQDQNSSSQDAWHQQWAENPDENILHSSAAHFGRTLNRWVDLFYERSHSHD